MLARASRINKVARTRRENKETKKGDNRVHTRTPISQQQTEVNKVTRTKKGNKDNRVQP